MNIEEIKSSIYQITTSKPGNQIIVLGGVHGCEQTGIAVVKKLINMFKKRDIELMAGSVVLALGNERAIEIGRRCARPGGDLNRFFSQEKLDDLSDQSYEVLRARELVEIMKDSDVLLDIHSTNVPSRPFLACENESKHHKIHKWFNAKDVITDPNYILSGGFYSTTDEYMNVIGGIGVCFETGYAKDISRVDEVVNSVLNILADQKMIECEINNDDKKYANRNIYKMHTRIDLTSKGFIYEKGFGKGDFEQVEKGQIIGYCGDKAFKSPVTGIVLLQTPKEMWRVGESVGYIAQKV